MTGQEGRRTLCLLRCLRLALVVLVTCAVALFFLIVPFRALLPAYPVPARGEGELRIHFLSVGQGDATAVEFPDGEVLLIDGGDGSFSANDALVRYLKGLQMTALSVLSTHADADHFAGLCEVLTVFDVEKVYLPVLRDAPEYERFLAAVREEGCPAEELTRYDVISHPSGAYLVCVSPYPIGETDENDASTVLYLSYQGVNALFCADIGAARERRLLSELSLGEDIFDSGEYRVRLAQTDILKVAHHGSDASSGEEWLQMLSPSAAVISCGAGNSYRHPAGGTLSRLSSVGAEVYRTDELGHILITVSGGSYTVSSEF